MQKMTFQRAFFLFFLLNVFITQNSIGQTINFDSDGFVTNDDYGSNIYTSGNIKITYSTGNYFEHATAGESTSSGLYVALFIANEKITIETIDGSEIDFQSFYYDGFTTAFINHIEGFKNLSSTGTITSGFVDGTNSLNSNFDDVDKVVIKSTLGFFSIFDTFVFGPAIAANTAPVVAGTTANQTVNDNNTISLFSGVTVTDADNVTATITLDTNAKGVLSGTDLSGFGPYTIASKTAANMQSAIRSLSFNPTDNRSATSETTTFTINIDDGTDNTNNNTTTVISSAVAPTVTNISSATSDDTFKLGDMINVVVTFSEIVLVSGTPQITLETGTTDRTIDYNGSGNGTSSINFTYTIQTGDESGDLDYMATTSLTAGTSIQDAGGKDVILTLFSPGSTNSLGDNKDLVIDGIVPSAPSIPNMIGPSDTGSSSADNITADTTPTFIGDSAESNATVTLISSVDGTVGTTTANGTGNWLLTSGALTATSHNITATVTDAAGNISAESSVLAIIIDPSAPTGYSVVLNQSPINNGNDNAVSFTFASAEVGTTYNYTFSSSGGAVTVTDSGTISTSTDQISSIDLSGLANGTITLSVTLTDVSGNTGLAATDTETKDSTAPTFSSSGSAPIDDATGVNTPDDIIIDFNEDIASGTGNITIRDVTGTTDFEVFNVATATATSTPGTGAIGILNDKIYINPTSNLKLGNEYAIQITSTAIDDLSENSFAGITDETTFSFTTLNPTVAFATTNSSGSENVSSANLEVSLSAISGSDVSVSYAVTGGTATGSGTDYTLASGTLTITAGDGNNSITIASIISDAILEANETVEVTLSSPTNATLGTNQVHTYAIGNDDTAAVTIANVSGAENSGAITVTATLDHAVQGGFTVDVSTSDGTATTADSDYLVITSQTLTFAGNANETQTFTITPTGDSELESDEALVVSLFNLSATTLSVTVIDGATVTINNDDFQGTVTTDDASSVTSTSVILGGDVISEGSSSVTERGIVYAITSENSNPQIGGTNVIKEDNGIGSGAFSKTILSLVANTQYSYLAYATNSQGTSYGTVKIFTTATLGLENILLNDSISLYPNPVNNELHIKTNHVKLEEATLYNILGKTIKNIKLNNKVIDFSGINSGVYLLKVTTDKGTFVKQIIKK